MQNSKRALSFLAITMCATALFASAQAEGEETSYEMRVLPNQQGGGTVLSNRRDAAIEAASRVGSLDPIDAFLERAYKATDEACNNALRLAIHNDSSPYARAPIETLVARSLQSAAQRALAGD